MTEMSRYEILDLLNRPKPLWLVNIDLGDGNLSGVDLNGANLHMANLCFITPPICLL